MKVCPVSTESVMLLGDAVYKLLSAIKRTDLEDITDKVRTCQIERPDINPSTTYPPSFPSP